MLTSLDMWLWEDRAPRVGDLRAVVTPRPSGHQALGDPDWSANHISGELRLHDSRRRGRVGDRVYTTHGAAAG